MANVYSTLFYRNGSLTAGSVIAYTVPAGFVAVVRDIDLFLNQPWDSQLLSGILVSTRFPTTALFGVLSPKARGNQPYHWEGRQVLNPGDELTLNVYDSGWEATISGFLLALP